MVFQVMWLPPVVRGVVVEPPVLGVCRRPDLSGSADQVRRHDEDGVPGVRAVEGAAAQSFRGVHPGMGGDSSG